MSDKRQELIERYAEDLRGCLILDDVILNLTQMLAEYDKLKSAWADMLETKRLKEFVEQDYKICIQKTLTTKKEPNLLAEWYVAANKDRQILAEIERLAKEGK